MDRDESRVTKLTVRRELIERRVSRGIETYTYGIYLIRLNKIIDNSQLTKTGRSNSNARFQIQNFVSELTRARRGGRKYSVHVRAIAFAEWRD